MAFLSGTSFWRSKKTYKTVPGGADAGSGMHDFG